VALMKIRTPVLGFTGESVGVSFRDGVGYTDTPAALAYFRSQGYGVEDPDIQPAPTSDDADLRSQAMPKKSASADAWRTYAVENGMSADEAATLSRDQLVERFTTSKEDEQ